mmetsp:Transcript_19778/g.26122  ORF Transcript_19778/g.26122 Transcript_19778/m.26122 type:complete len:85 (-) Transcript_19778:255-509(-)
MIQTVTIMNNYAVRAFDDFEEIKISLSRHTREKLQQYGRIDTMLAALYSEHLLLGMTCLDSFGHHAKFTLYDSNSENDQRVLCC